MQNVINRALAAKKHFFHSFILSLLTSAIALTMASCGGENDPEQEPFALKLVRQSDALLEVAITPVDNKAPYIYGYETVKQVWRDDLLADYLKTNRLDDHTYQELADNKEIKRGTIRVPEENLEAGKEFIFYACQVDEELNIVKLVFKHYATLQPGRLSGEFQIDNEGHKVRFSKGNLRQKRANGEYSFSENQWDALGEENKTSAYWDLLPWGLAEGEASHIDFGTKPIVNGGNEPNQWRTLTADEWEYLIKNNQVGYGAIAGVEGLFLAPRGVDNVNLKKKDNFFTQKQWWEIEVLGAVFLPVGGKQDRRSSVNNLEEGYYWTSTLCKDKKDESDKDKWYIAYVHFDKSDSNCTGEVLREDSKTKWSSLSGYFFVYGEASGNFSVRLVQDVK